MDMNYTILDKDGKSKAFCNDEPVTLSFLKKISLCLLDIHSQHQSQSLLKPDSQRKYIDDSAGNSALVDRLTSVYKSYQSNLSELNVLSKNNLTVFGKFVVVPDPSLLYVKSLIPIPFGLPIGTILGSTL